MSLHGASPSIDAFFRPDGALGRILPRFEERSCQREMARAVARAVAEESVLLAEAGTGTGKTLAYLIPALSSGKKILLSTATKALQDQILDHDVPLLLRHLFPKHRVEILKGRRNYLCLRRFREFTYQPTLWNPEEAQWIRLLREWAAKTRTGDRSKVPEVPEDASFWHHLTSGPHQCLGLECPHHEECFVQRIRHKAAGADLLVVNHHLFFAAFSVEEAGGPWDLFSRFQVYIFDEAHHLEDVASLYFGLEFSSRALLDTIRDVERILTHSKVPAQARSQIPSKLHHLNRQLLELHGLLLEKSRPGTHRHVLDVKRLGSRFLEKTREIQENMLALNLELEPLGEGFPSLEPACAHLTSLRSHLDQLIRQEDARTVYWYEIDAAGKGFVLRGTPLDVASLLSDSLFSEGRAVILTSATLATAFQGRPSFSFVRKRLGVPESAQELVLDSPFDFARQARLYIPRTLPLPHERDFCEAVCREAVRIFRKTRGRALFLFTSYRNLHEVRDRLVQRRDLLYPVLCQGERSKRALLAEFTGKVDSILLATYSFWEGIDVPGEALSCVLIDKLPFEVPDDPITAARMEWVKQSGGNAFYQYQVPRAVLQLKQGIGRLIRSRDDRGLLVLFDRRILTRPYGNVFFKSLPPVPILKSLDELPEDFFNG